MLVHTGTATGAPGSLSRTSVTSHAGWTPGAAEVSARSAVSMQRVADELLRGGADHGERGRQVGVADRGELRCGRGSRRGKRRAGRRGRRPRRRSGRRSGSAWARVGIAAPPPGGGASSTATGVGSPTTPATMTCAGRTWRRGARRRTAGRSSTTAGPSRGAQPVLLPGLSGVGVAADAELRKQRNDWSGPSVGRSGREQRRVEDRAVVLVGEDHDREVRLGRRKPAFAGLSSARRIAARCCSKPQPLAPTRRELRRTRRAARRCSCGRAATASCESEMNAPVERGRVVLEHAVVAVARAAAGADRPIAGPGRGPPSSSCPCRR